MVVHEKTDFGPRSLTAFTAKPLSLIWLLGGLFFVFSLFVGTEALAAKMRGDAVDGFTTVILLILITGSAVLAAICILSVYIRQIFHEVKRRPRYLIGDRALPSRGNGTADTRQRLRRGRDTDKDDA